MDKIQVQTFLQDAVRRYTSETAHDTYEGTTFVIEDVLEKIIVENEKELPKDISGWFRVWQAYTTLDCSDTMHDAGWPTDYGDDNSKLADMEINLLYKLMETQITLQDLS